MFDGRSVIRMRLCDPTVFGDLILTCQTPGVLPNQGKVVSKEIETFPLPTTSCLVVERRRKDISKEVFRRSSESDVDEQKSPEFERRRTSFLVDQLLVDIYNHSGISTDYYSGTSSKSQRNYSLESIRSDALQEKSAEDVRRLVAALDDRVGRAGRVLVRQLKRRDALRRHREALCDVITRRLRSRSSEPEDMRFSITPLPGESGFAQWHSAMKMVVQLPEGIPAEFRRTLWLTLADRHLASRRIDWAKVERNCFSEWSHPADAELGVQIVKDLHRTGCSLFCGEDGQENQALLKKVLLAYARWNKNVGYCQGFNMLAALILQVTEKCEADALKLMIYLIEGVLPDSYFADSLRGLSVDMAVFRELLRTRLPKLSRHLDALQKAAKDGSTSYEPPLTNVFTMQWFLTLFCNCLPQEVVLRVWDLILLEGNEILLRTALAIWQALADRIMGVRSADEFYCIMGVLTREMLEFGFVDANSLIKSVEAIGPLTELRGLREHYLYNITPWSSGPSPSGYSCEEAEKQLNLYPKERLVLDIGVLKKQYSKLKQRQRQAHIIFSAAVSRQPPRSTPVAINHLLLGRSALVPVKRVGPPKGAVPPPRKPGGTLQWKDAEKKSSSSEESSDTELCDDPDKPLSEDEADPIEEDPAPSTVHNTSDNKVLMTSDNIEEIKTVAEEPPCESNADPEEVRSLDNSLVSDDGFDFEKFLEERIRCMKQSNVCSDEIADCSSEGRVSNARKNSERALEIIQENSLILHRILQCQSRYSPPVNLVQDDFKRSISPLPLDQSNEEVEENKPKESSAVANLDYLNLDTQTPKDEDNQILIQEDLKRTGSLDEEESTVQPNSKYQQIFEISKNLDERYKALILDQPPMVVKTNFSRPEDLNLPEPSSLSPRGSGDYNRRLSPSKDSPPEDQKSPSKAYNPFPIKLSTRQNKDVGVKLGLYKK